MKLFSFLCFKYLHIKLIDFLLKLKFKNNKRNAEKMRKFYTQSF